jgi:hypothetical protein
MAKKLTTEEFIEKARRVHGDKYDYSKVEYINNGTLICIICPKHGEFWQTPHKHLQGRRCFKCYHDDRTLTTEEFIEKAKQIHRDKYDYSKVNYVNVYTKICIICPKHGEFWQKPNNHLQGKGCPYCSGNMKSDLKEFIKGAKKVHDNFYDYSKVEYVNSKTKVCIICPEHGEFWQKPNNHLNGQCCPICARNIVKNKLKMTLDEFIEKSNLKHNNKYDYSKVEYVDIKTPVCIVCPEHGEFWQTPRHHLNGHSCPICRESKLEKEVNNFLLKNNILFERQKKFDWLRLNNPLSLDFYLPDYNIAIECQGKQHFKPVDIFGGEEEFKKTVERDKMKAKLCNENDVHLMFFNYGDSNRIKTLSSILKV